MKVELETIDKGSFIYIAPPRAPVLLINVQFSTIPCLSRLIPPAWLNPVLLINLQSTILAPVDVRVLIAPIPILLFLKVIKSHY